MLAEDDGEDLEVPDGALDVSFLEEVFRCVPSVGSFEDDGFEVALEEDVAEDIGPTRARNSLYFSFNSSTGLTCFLIPLR